MSHELDIAVGLDQMIEFMKRKIFSEEASVQKAKRDQIMALNMVKKYVKKGLIHGGREAIAPPEEQWKNISLGDLSPPCVFFIFSLIIFLVREFRLDSALHFLIFSL